MQSNFLAKFLTITLLIFSLTVNAQHEEHEGSPEEVSLKTKIKESINHHLLDSHDFTFFSDSETGKHYGFSLPVILWDDGVQVFSSSKFHHGETVAENNGNYYTLYHNKIYRTDVEGTITLDDHHHPTQVKPLDFSITKSVLMIIITGMEKDGSKYTGGKILDPASGSVYSCKIWRDGKNLQVRGYMGLSIIGRSQKWLPAN